MCATKNEGGLTIWRNAELTASSGTSKRHRCQDRVQYAGSQQCRIHPRHLHPRHKQGAGTGGSKYGEFSEAGTLTPDAAKASPVQGEVAFTRYEQKTEGLSIPQSFCSAKIQPPLHKGAFDYYPVLLEIFPFGSNLGQTDCSG